MAFLGRVALYNEKWSDAIAAYREIMNMGYSLYDDYKALFSQAGETSREIIFAVRYEGPGQGEGACFNAHWNTPMESLNGTLDLADDYYIQATGLKTTDTNYGEMNGGVLNVSQPVPLILKDVIPVYTQHCLFPECIGMEKEEKPHGMVERPRPFLWFML